MRIPFIAGNWKMYKSIAEAKEYTTMDIIIIGVLLFAPKIYSILIW